MPDTKITALAAITVVDPAADVLPIVDISDTSMAASGTTKKITINQILGASGTATFSALTVSGAATAQRFIPSSATVPTNGLYLPAANELGWAINSAEAMRLNANGLGVGGAPTGTGPIILVEGIAGTYAKFNSKVGAKTWSAGYRSGTLQYEIQEDGTERFVIANGGNVGIGVTPSAWASIYKTIELPNGSSIWGQTDVPQVSIQTNAFLNSSFQWIYKTTAAASNYRQTAGTHLWFTAPSGTAGNVATLTQRMQLDVNGNLILLSSNTPATLSNNGELTVNATSNTNLRFSYRGSDGTTRVANITLA